jgi:uncharacterized membrane protein (UPF0127 family)
VKNIKVINQTKQVSEPILAKYCQSFFCQLRGLMFTKYLPDDQGLLLVQRSDSRVNSSIHMMFMRMDLAVIWINSDFKVVDRVLARRWKLAYLPRSAAKFVLETGINHIDEFDIGDKVCFEDVLLDLNG